MSVEYLFQPLGPPRFLPRPHSCILPLQMRQCTCSGELLLPGEPASVINKSQPNVAKSGNDWSCVYEPKESLAVTAGKESSPLLTFLFLPKSEKASGCGSKSLGGRKAVLESKGCNREQQVIFNCQILLLPFNLPPSKSLHVSCLDPSTCSTKKWSIVVFSCLEEIMTVVAPIETHLHPLNSEIILLLAT